MQSTKAISSQIIILTPTLTIPVGEATKTFHGGKMTKTPKVTKTIIDRIKVMVTKGMVQMHHQSPILN
jgi:hypothetical protein